MQVYRIAHPRFAQDLSGEGARLYGGRWNAKGYACLYTAEHPALALLELAVHFTAQSLPDFMSMIVISIPDELIINAELVQLNDDSDIQKYSEELGTSWLKKKSSLVMKVPSIVCPKSFNYLINPAHFSHRDVFIEEEISVIIDGRIKS
jgi:RES domain-containing protein